METVALIRLHEEGFEVSFQVDVLPAYATEILPYSLNTTEAIEEAQSLWSTFRFRPVVEADGYGGPVVGIGHAAMSSRIVCDGGCWHGELVPPDYCRFCRGTGKVVESTDNHQTVIPCPDCGGCGDMIGQLKRARCIHCGGAIWSEEANEATAAPVDPALRW